MKSRFENSETRSPNSKINPAPEHHHWEKDRKRYIYPMVTIQEKDIRYSFYCSNKDGEIRDNIYLRKALFLNNKWEYGEEKLVLPHGAEEQFGDYIWDKKHVCDPAVVAGEFALGSEKYPYAMFYTGVRDDGNKGLNNSLGVAVAKKLEGPWIKRNGPLLSPFPGEEQFWGVGQPSVTSIDGKGKLLLFYTRGAKEKTSMFRHPIDLSDVENPKIDVCDAMELPIRGLCQLDGSNEDMLNNGSLMYDSCNDIFWLARDGHPYPKGDYISEFIQIAWASGALIWEGKGQWQVHGNVKTSEYRSHNARFVSNVYGALLNPEKLELNVTKAVKPWGISFFSPNTRYWSYRPITFIIDPSISPDEHHFLKFSV